MSIAGATSAHVSYSRTVHQRLVDEFSLRDHVFAVEWVGEEGIGCILPAGAALACPDGVQTPALAGGGHLLRPRLSLTDGSP